MIADFIPPTIGYLAAIALGWLLRSYFAKRSRGKRMMQLDTRGGSRPAFLKML